MRFYRIFLKGTLWIHVFLIAVHFVWFCMRHQHGIVDEPRSQYDFIIVGGGSSGCVVARRLWEQTNLSVLVVEAGQEAPWLSGIPLLAPALQRYTAANWPLKTVQQRNSQRGLNERQSSWPRGKALGGSSVLNYMLHMWGSRSDFEEVWSGGDESTGWGFESVTSFFRKTEGYRGKESVSDIRGKSGPMAVTEFDKHSSPLVTAFLKGVAALGLQIGDLNGDLEDGAMLSQSNTLNGWRMSTFDAYLKPIMEVANIHILTNTLVQKVIIEDGAAVGVQAVNTYSGASYRVDATKEVILSAGVIGSPHLLMLSGIGPKKHLEEHGIPVVQDLPGVGGNLRDHLNVPLYFHLHAPVSATTSKIASAGNLWNYATKGKGYLSHSGVEAMARFPMPGDNTTYSKMFFMLFNLGSVNAQLFTKISNFNDDIFQETFPDTKNNSKEGFIILASCTHPVSNGRISLASSDPIEPPLIDPNYLEHDEDVKCLTEALKVGARLGTTKPLQDLGSRIHLPKYWDCISFIPSLDNDRYLECWIRMVAMTAYHPVGTCSMGNPAEPMAVLDWRLRVRGVKNLRVVDSSAFPHLTAGNPHAVVLMLAEKGAHFIVQDIKRQTKS